jgi:signal peptidase II
MSTAVLPKDNALPWLWLSVLLIGLDQATKWLAVASLPYQVQVAFVPGLWNWHLTHNTGAAFSFLANAGGWQHGFFVVLATLISVVLAVALRRVPREDWRNAFPFALIIAGALGNLVDRLRLGYVVDFVEWHAGDHYWPVFNLADSCIVVGAVLMVWYSLRQRELPPA